MRTLTVPNWSFGRDSQLLRGFEETLSEYDLDIHFLESDVDHNRTVSAFSGEADEVGQALMDLASLAFPSIDLNRHIGVHPRIGALDVCPFVPLGEYDVYEFQDWIETIAERIADAFEIPVFLYEKSERGRHEADLPGLRRGGFGGLLERELNPDYGPIIAHNRLGATVLGWRDPLIAMNVNVNDPDPTFARSLARRIRELRADGDPRFLGVRALGFPLPSRELSQVSLNLTLPDLTHVDPVVEYINEHCLDSGVRVDGYELVGVIRDVDLEYATWLPFKSEQVVVIN